MANPKVVSWRSLKKVARYLVGVERVIWKFGWQDRVTFSRVFSDSDWGKTVETESPPLGEYGCWGGIASRPG
eukprot:12414312-Karenia_brevis.AAC.1